MNILFHVDNSSKLKLTNTTYITDELNLRGSYGKSNLYFLRVSELKTYFNAIALKIPSCLNNSSTILSKRVTRSIAFLCRYLMYSGLLLKCVAILNKVLSHFFLESLQVISHSFCNDRTFILNKKKKFSLAPASNNLQFLKVYNYINYKLLSLKPIFYFYIYKVDKQIYKNSRGKSGKYTFLWKYIQPAKRVNLITRQLSKDIQYNSGKSLEIRAFNSILKHLNSTKSTFTYKSIRFSNNYAFLNSKTTLLKNFKTVKST